MFINLGEAIKELRQSLGYTQEEFAQGICSQSQISKIEKGEISPYVHTLIQMALKLGWNLDILSKESDSSIQLYPRQYCKRQKRSEK